MEKQLKDNVDEVPCYCGGINESCLVCSGTGVRRKVPVIMGSMIPTPEKGMVVRGPNDPDIVSSISIQIGKRLDEVFGREPIPPDDP
jgi:hypothetical protein